MTLSISVHHRPLLKCCQYQALKPEEKNYVV